MNSITIGILAVVVYGVTAFGIGGYFKQDKANLDEFGNLSTLAYCIATLWPLALVVLLCVFPFECGWKLGRRIGLRESKRGQR